MSGFANLLILMVIWVIYLVSAWIYIRRRQFSMMMGVNIGIIHMVLIPFTVFAFMGELAGDPGGLIPAVNWEVQRGSVTKILGMIGLYGMCDLLYQAFPKHPPKPNDGRPSVWDALPTIKPMQLMIGFVVMAIMLFIVTGVASGGHWADAKAEFLLGWGTPAILLLNVFAAIRLAMLISFAAMFMYDRITLQKFLVLFGLCCALDLYTTGNRIFTLQVLLVIAGMLVVRQRWYQFGMLALAALPFGILMTMFPLIRVYMHAVGTSWGLSSASAALTEGFQEAKDYYGPSLGIPQFLMGVSEGLNVNVLVVVVEEFHQMVGLLMGTSLLRGFVFWIPRSIWPNKPETLSVLIGQYLFGGGSRGVSMGATVFGEFWANFGFVGFAVMPVVLLTINFALTKMIRDTTMRMIAVFVFGYTIVRMPISDFTVLYLFVVVFLNMTRLHGKDEALPAS